MKTAILKICIVLGLIFSQRNNVCAQTFYTKNGDEVIVFVYLTSDKNKEEIIKAVDFSSNTFISFELEDDEVAAITFENTTKDTTYTYLADKLAFNWKIKDQADAFGHILLDEDDMTYTFKTGCTIFHIKFYNPRNEEDEENSIWIKIWNEE